MWHGPKPGKIQCQCTLRLLDKSVLWVVHETGKAANIVVTAKCIYDDARLNLSALDWTQDWDAQDWDGSDMPAEKACWAQGS